MSREQQKISRLLKAFSQRPIAYQKIYAQITGSVTAGLLLSQLVYWWGAVEGREFWKTDKDLMNELTMGPKELRNAKAKLKKLGIIGTTRKGVPCRTFYKLEESTVLAQISSLAEKAKLDKPKGPNLIGRNVPAITKTNTRDHTETTGKQKRRISPERLLELDSSITEARNEFCGEIEKIKYGPNSDEFRLSKLLLDFILERKLNFRKPNLQKWCIHIYRLIHLDKRTPEQIEAVIRWCQEDDFWQNNILSTEKLRKQIDKLELGMEKDSNRETINPLEVGLDGLTPREHLRMKLEKEKQQKREDTERT